MKSAKAARLSSDVVGSSTTPISRVHGSSSTTTMGGFDFIARMFFGTGRSCIASFTADEAAVRGAESERRNKLTSELTGQRGHALPVRFDHRRWLPLIQNITPLRERASSEIMERRGDRARLEAVVVR